jgi:hypothetical protein
VVFKINPGRQRRAQAHYNSGISRLVWSIRERRRRRRGKTNWLWIFISLLSMNSNRAPSAMEMSYKLAAAVSYQINLIDFIISTVLVKAIRWIELEPFSLSLRISFAKWYHSAELSMRRSFYSSSFFICCEGNFYFLFTHLERWDDTIHSGLQFTSHLMHLLIHFQLLSPFEDAPQAQSHTHSENKIICRI